MILKVLYSNICVYIYIYIYRALFFYLLVLSHDGLYICYATYITYCKGDNILVAKNTVTNEVCLKLSDFGISVRLKKTEKL